MATASLIIKPECSICFESFKTPKVLPCGHTFCLKCVQSHIGDNKVKFRCPMCQQDIQIPEGGPHKFTTNFIIQTYSDQPLSTVQQKCPNHKQRDVDFYCNNCKVGFCFRCVTHHKDHETLDIECTETRKKTVDKLQHSQTIIQNKIKDLENIRTTLSETYEQLKSWCEDACAKITEKTEKIISDLRKSCEDRKRDIRNNLAENKLNLEKTETELTQQIDKLKTQSNIPSETSTLNILQSFPQIEELEKLCQSLKVELPKIQYKKWQENNVKLDVGILGSVVASVYYIPSMYQFRFDINDMKDVDKYYYSKDKLHQYDIIWSCCVWKYSNGNLIIFIELLREDNPNLESCIVDYKLSLLNTVDDNKTLTKTYSNKRIEKDDSCWWGWCWFPITWSKLTDKNNGYLTSNGQFVIQLDITQIRELSFK